MMERADYKPRNNAIISCVISRGEKSRGGEQSELALRVSHHSVSVFQEAVRSTDEWKVET